MARTRVWSQDGAPALSWRASSADVEFVQMDELEARVFVPG
jgi:hypothetical protein